MQNKGISSLIVLLIILGIALVGCGATYYYISIKPQQKLVACTMEGKLCPDGSAVGRTGPNCEFAQCPKVIDETSDWKTYANTQYGFEFKYPTSFIVDDQNSTINSLFFNTPSGAGFFIDNPIVDPYGKTVTLEEYFSAYSYDGNYDRSNKMINGLAWTRFVTKPWITDTNKNHGSIRYVFERNVTKNEFFFNGDISSTNANLFEQMVSTFKFTK